MSREMTISQWHVPIDDVKHYWYAIFTSFGAPVNKDEMRRQRLELYELPDYVPRKNKHNDYGFDPHEQEHATYTGMGADINVHDQWACELMGAIQDRTAGASRHVGQGDRRLSAAVAPGARAVRQGRTADDGARSRRRPRRSPARPASTASARPATGRAIGNAPATTGRRRKAGRTGRLMCRSMAHAPRRSVSFVERHGLWTAAQARAANVVAQAIKQHKLELVRFSFADQHGVLRGKTLVAADAPALMQAGVTMTTTLLAKDTAHKTVYPVFTAGGGFAMAEMQGGGDFVMVADPSTFNVLPWAAPNTGWLLCDIYFSNGKTGAVLHAASAARRAGHARRGGLRFPRRARSRIPSVQAGESAAGAGRRHLAAGGARSEPAQPGLSVSDRDALRSDRRRRWSRSGAACRRSACRCARSKSSSGRASANSPSARSRRSPPPTR